MPRGLYFLTRFLPSSLPLLAGVSLERPVREATSDRGSRGATVVPADHLLGGGGGVRVLLYFLLRTNETFKITTKTSISNLGLVSQSALLRLSLHINSTNTKINIVSYALKKKKIPRHFQGLQQFMDTFPSI